MENHVKRFRKKVSEAIVKGLGGKCRLCGYEKCLQALEAHHVNPETKDFNLRRYNKANKRALYKEASKCVLLCANCHREVHAGLASIEKLELIFDENAAEEICVKKYPRQKRADTKIDEVLMRKMLAEGSTKAEVARFFGVSWTAVHNLYKK